MESACDSKALYQISCLRKDVLCLGPQKITAQKFDFSPGWHCGIDLGIKEACVRRRHRASARATAVLLRTRPRVSLDDARYCKTESLRNPGRACESRFLAIISKRAAWAHPLMVARNLLPQASLVLHRCRQPKLVTPAENLLCYVDETYSQKAIVHATRAGRLGKTG